MGKPHLEYEEPRSPWSLVALVSFLAAGVLLVVLVSGAIAAWRLSPRGAARRPAPAHLPIQSITFASPDGSAEPIRLGGFCAPYLGEHLFNGFRDVVYTPGGDEIQNASWLVTLELMNGKTFHFYTQDVPTGDLWVAGGASRQVAGDLEPLLAARAGLALLDRRDQRDYQETEQRVRALDEEEIDHLLALLQSPDRLQQAMALMALNYVVSPQLRREHRRKAMVFQTEVVDDWRSANDHPRAGEVRAAALAAFDDWEQGRVVASGSGPSWLKNALFESLRELADASVADHLAAALRKRMSIDHEAEEIVAALEACYCLPPLVRPLYYCPTGESPQNIAAAAVEAQQRRNQRKALILTWHNEHRDSVREALLAAAMSVWEPRINDSEHLANSPNEAHSDFAPLIRKGAAIVPYALAAKQRTHGIQRQAVYDLIIALATGEK